MRGVMRMMLSIIFTAVSPLLTDGVRAQQPDRARGREWAERTLQERKAPIVNRESSHYKSLLALPIMGDQDQLRVALAVFNLGNFAGGNEFKLLQRHLSRLVAEKLLGRPATRVKDVAAAIAYEEAEAASFATLQENAFRRLVRASRPRQGIADSTIGLPEVWMDVWQDPPADLEVIGDLRVLIPQAAGAGEPFERRCTLRSASSPEWSPRASGGREATLPCQRSINGEQFGDFGRALERLRAGQVGVKIVPADVMTLPVALLESLPYEQAVNLVSSGGWVAIVNYKNTLIGWRTALAPMRVLFRFLLKQLAVAAILILLSRRAPRSPAGEGVKWMLAYLALVVLAHAAMLVTSVREGSLLLLAGWLYLGLPLFLPGLCLGVVAVASGFRNATLRTAKIVLGVLAVTTPILEWLLAPGVRTVYTG